MRLHQAGMTAEQAQMVYDLAAEKMMPMLKEIMMDIEADNEVEKLIEHFGGKEKWQEVSRQLLSYGQQNLPRDVLESLLSSHEGVLALYRMMKGQEPKMARETSNVDSSNNQAELSSMMRDPKYWRDKDPALVAKVTEGFKNLYSK